ncbi:TPA: hypothetical protein JD342_21095 [Citrobacter freundii]|nr:hypothetical protein [Citrobacter freundii]
MIKKTRTGVYLRVGANTASACNGLHFCGALRKKKRKSLPSSNHPAPFFDLLRLFYRFSCSKITQLFCLLSVRFRNVGF